MEKSSKAVARKTTSTEVARKTTSIAAAVPDYLKTNDMGVDNIKSSDMVIPRLKIVQGLSRVKDENDALKEGEFYHTLTKESMGNSVIFYVLFFWPSLIWFSEDQKFLGSEHNDGSQLVRIGDINFDDMAVRSKALGAFNYMICLSKDITSGTLPEILIYSATSAAQRPARNLNGKLKYNAQKQVPIWGQKIKMTTLKKQFPRGSAYMPQFQFGSFASEGEAAVLKELYNMAKMLFTSKETHQEEPTAEAHEAEAPIKERVPSSDETPDETFDENPFG